MFGSEAAQEKADYIQHAEKEENVGQASKAPTVAMTLNIGRDESLIRLKVPGVYTFEGNPFYALILPFKMREGFYEAIADTLEFYQGSDRTHVAFTDRNVNGVREDGSQVVIDYLKSILYAIEIHLK